MFQKLFERQMIIFCSPPMSFSHIGKEDECMGEISGEKGSFLPDSPFFPHSFLFHFVVDILLRFFFFKKDRFFLLCFC